jgi:predicted O-methyltransferase YrrM
LALVLKSLNPIKRNHKIAKTAGITQKRGELLFRVCNYFQADAVLEIGTVGISNICNFFGKPEAQITTLEGCPETSKIAQEQLENLV